MLLCLIFLAPLWITLALAIHISEEKKRLAWGIFVLLGLPVPLLFFSAAVLPAWGLDWLDKVLSLCALSVTIGVTALLCRAGRFLWRVLSEPWYLSWLFRTAVLVGIGFLCAAVLLIGFLFSIVGIDAWKVTEIEHVAFGDTGYELTISQTGEPDWPFGAAHCRFDFTRGDETVSTLKVDLDNDGCAAGSGNFRVYWFTDFVRVVVMQRGQLHRLYDLYFDGTTEMTYMRSVPKAEEKRAAEAAEADEAVRKKVAGILFMDLPQDSYVCTSRDAYDRRQIHNSSGDAFIMLWIDDGSALIEQIMEKGTWNPLPLPEDLRKLVERTKTDYGTDEELGDGYWFFLDRHEEAVDRTDYRAALEREELHYILAHYSTSSLAANYLVLYQVDVYGEDET